MQGPQPTLNAHFVFLSTLQHGCQFNFMEVKTDALRNEVFLCFFLILPLYSIQSGLIPLSLQAQNEKGL